MRCGVCLSALEREVSGVAVGRFVALPRQANDEVRQVSFLALLSFLLKQLPSEKKEERRRREREREEERERASRQEREWFSPLYSTLFSYSLVSVLSPSDEEEQTLTSNFVLNTQYLNV